MSSDISIQKIQKLVKDYFESQNKEKKFIPGKTKIHLQVPSYGWEEVNESLDSLLSTYVTMGKKVEAFEKLFSDYLGLNYSTMVNSGSSANLIAMSMLSNPVLSNRLNPGDEVITPATTWATTVYPIGDVNAIPVLVDADSETFNISTDEIEHAITDKTKAIMPVHMLGNPCDIKKIMQIARDNDLFVIEDCCEAHGAEVDGKRVGTFGDIGTFSFFFSHIISTIEGGMVTTNNEELYELSRSLRVFGWARSLKKYEEYAKKYNNIDKRFLFVNTGFNMRPTEIQGAFGMHQIKKLENFIKIRKDNADYWNKRLSIHSDYLVTQEERRGTRHAWFGFPLTVKPGSPFTRDELANFLESKKIETRPVQIPNIAKQPAINFIKHRTIGNLPNSTYIMNNSFWFGNHHGLSEEEREYIADCIDEFVKGKA